MCVSTTRAADGREEDSRAYEASLYCMLGARGQPPWAAGTARAVEGRSLHGTDKFALCATAHGTRCAGEV